MQHKCLLIVYSFYPYWQFISTQTTIKNAQDSEILTGAKSEGNPAGDNSVLRSVDPAFVSGLLILSPELIVCCVDADADMLSWFGVTGVDATDEMVVSLTGVTGCVSDAGIAVVSPGNRKPPWK